MNKDKDQDTQEHDADARSWDTVARLMYLAGPRADIPADLEKRVHHNVRREWQKSTSLKKPVRWAMPAALAATILVAIALNVRVPDAPLQPVGQIAHVVGISDSTQHPFQIGNTVYVGDSIDTGANQGLSIALAGNISLRIAGNTAIRLDQADEFTLLRGRIYADSGNRIYNDRHITVHTANGSATDIGTQFSVTYDQNRMSVSVREGRVDVVNEMSSITAEAGDRLTFQKGMEVDIEHVTPYDASWRWAASLAPGFDIDNRSLLDFLKWASRETGKELIFSNDEIRMAAMGTQLFGSVEKFTPMDALESVLATTQFRYRIDERSITIEK